MKSTPARGVKQYLKPWTYKQWEGILVIPDRLPFEE